MLKCFATIMMVAVGAFVPVAFASSSDSTDDMRLVHTLSLQVSVDGQQVMDPVFQMTSEAPAQLFIGSAEGDGHTLVVSIIEAEQKGRPLQSSGAHFSLWKGAVDSGVRLLDDVLVLGEGRRLKGAKDALHSRAAGQEASVTLVSHATQMMPRAGASARSSCSAMGGSVAPKGGGALLSSTKSNCCSTKCGDGSGATLKCCNVISGCCQCGACCSIP